MIFFDLDGTLLDSNGVWLDIDVAFLGRHGISPVPEDYTWYVTRHGAPDAARYTRERFGLRETEEEILAAWRDMAQEAYAAQLELKPGVRELLERCRGLFAAALLLLYGGQVPAQDRELALSAAKNLTKAQIMGTIELLQKYRQDCVYNVGPGHVLGGLAVELEGIL